MKKIVLFLATLGGVLGITWLGRDRLLPPPAVPTGPAPRFRTPHRAAGTTVPPTGDAAERNDSGGDLTDITGIGPVFAGRLADAGITGVADLAAGDAADIAGRIDVSTSTVEGWIGQARTQST